MLSKRVLDQLETSVGPSLWSQPASQRSSALLVVLLSTALLCVVPVGVVRT